MDNSERPSCQALYFSKLFLLTKGSLYKFSVLFKSSYGSSITSLSFDNKFSWIEALYQLRNFIFHKQNLKEIQLESELLRFLSHIEV